MKKALLSCIVIASGFFAMTGLSHADTYKSGEIISQIQEIRAGVEKDSPVISKVWIGQEVLIVEKNENWAKIKFGTGLEGYIEPSAIKLYKSGVINKDRVNFRTQPTTNSDVIDIMRVGSRVDVLDEGESWSKVRFENKEGYVFNELITIHTNSNNNVSRGDTRSAEKLLEVAYSKLGTPYRYGGTSSSGFDCSGFVQYTYKNALNIELPRVSASQSRAGTQVSRDELQPGDIVYFDTTGGRSRVTHVGIYVSDDNFIHASSGSIRQVIISSLNERHYSNGYLGATRIIN